MIASTSITTTFMGIPFMGIIVPIWVYILYKVKNVIGDNYFAE